MPIDKASVLKQIDDVLARFKEVEGQTQFDFMSQTYVGVGGGVSNTEITEVITIIKHAIERFRPQGRVTFGDEALTQHVSRDAVVTMKTYAGMLRALRADYDADRLQSFRELVHADLFADFLEMAYHLLEEGYKDAAAVMAGGVLEEHLRKLGGRHAVPLTTTDKAGNIRPKMIDAMNTDLTKAGTYNKIEKQSVTAWAAIRNAAAHGDTINKNHRFLGISPGQKRGRGRMEKMDAFREAMAEMRGGTAEELSCFIEKRYGVEIEPRFIPVFRASLQEREKMARLREARTAAPIPSANVQSQAI